MLIKRYGQQTQFLTRFNPDMQRQVCATPDACMFNDLPTLADLTAYGTRFPTAWLVPQLKNLSEFCGCRDKMQAQQLEECAFVIATEFQFLKVTEVMLFMHRFKAGRYGRFYGAVDPLVITTSLRNFLDERSAAYERHDRELRQRQRDEWRRKAVPPPAPSRPNEN